MLNKFVVELSCEDSSNADRLDWLDAMHASKPRYNFAGFAMPVLHAKLVANDVLGNFPVLTNCEPIRIPSKIAKTVASNDVERCQHNEAECMLALREELFCRLIEANKLVTPEQFGWIMASDHPLDFLGE